MILAAMSYQQLSEQLTDRYVEQMNALKTGRIKQIHEAACCFEELVNVIKRRSEKTPTT